MHIRLIGDTKLFLGVSEACVSHPVTAGMDPITIKQKSTRPQNM